jgi:succinate dehydrogenase/fumarate reductase flavoprotein subunit
MPQLLSTCERVVRDSAGCEILLGAESERLLVQDGRVCGAEIMSSSGERRSISARYTLLATGGFGGDAELRAQLIHPLARDLPLRANPYSTGDGLRLGQSAGAGFGQEDAGFYGHLVPFGVATKDVHELWEMTFYHSEHGVLLNLDGRRFVDETVGDHLNTLAVLDQPEARALFVCDQRIHEQWMLRPYVEGVEPVDPFKRAYRRGARCAIAEELEEFDYLPEEWGYSGPVVRESLQAFNEACVRGRLEPPRAVDAAPLLDPPYYVTELVPAITFSFGGLLIDTEARVLDELGQPIPGLLAAGADSGGVWFRAYAGGIATALVFGLQAAETVLSHAPARPAA